MSARVYLLDFGDMLIPRHLWNAMQRFDAWILQRVKLKHDQQVPEWMGEKYVGIAERPQVQEDIARDCEM
jgi:hypothetical protein